MGAPDLVVEVVSTNDRWSEVEDKVAEWLAAGVCMVLRVDPRRRVVVHRPNRPSQLLTQADTLGGEDVVPGWQLPVRELFSRLPTAP